MKKNAFCPNPKGGRCLDRRKSQSFILFQELNMRQTVFLALLTTLFVFSNACEKALESESGSFVKKLEISEKVDVLLQDAGMKGEVFKVKGKKDHKLSIWLETYVNGNLQESFSMGETVIPKKGERVEKKFRFSRLRKLTHGFQQPEQVIWQFGFTDSRSLQSWKTDPLRKADLTSVDGDIGSVRLTPGQTKTIWKLKAAGPDEDVIQSGSESEIINTHYAVLLIKCRMEKRKPGEEARSSTYDDVTGFIER
jgi:hypothetical protein